MHGKTPMIIFAASLLSVAPQVASASPLIGGGAIAEAQERLSPVESVHYYRYRGYGGYGRGYYGRGYYGYGRGYYSYGRGYYGGYGRGYYGGYRYY